MNTEDAIARLRAKASAVERAHRQAEKVALFTRATTCNRRNQGNRGNVKSVEHVIADLSAKASMVEILSLTAAELQEQTHSVRSRSLSPCFRAQSSRAPAFPKLHSLSPQSSYPQTQPLPPRTPMNPGCRQTLGSPRVFSPHGESSRVSPGKKSSSKTKLQSQHDFSPNSHRSRYDLPRQYDFSSSPRGRSPRPRESQHLLSPGSRSSQAKSQSHHHPLCLQGRNIRFPCSCHSVSVAFQEHTTPTSEQHVMFSSAPRYCYVAGRGFEDMDLVALSPPAWREELAPDLVEVSSQERVSPITIPSIIEEERTGVKHYDDSFCGHSQDCKYRKREGKTRNKGQWATH